MDVFKLLGTLWREHERAHLNKSSIILYFRLVYEANQSFWKGPLVISWEYLGRVLGLSPETLGRAISDLKSRGLITYERKGRHSYFWFPDHFDNRSGNQSEDNNHFDNRSGNRSGNRSENRSENRSDLKGIKVINTIRHENVKTKNKDIRSPYGDLATPVAESSSRLDNPTKSDSNGKLSKVEQDVISTWETIVGPFDHTWIPLLRRALRACYPSQIKNAIVVLAKSKLEVIQEQGFEYVLEPLEKGAFGKRGNKKKMPKKFETKLAGLKEFLAEGDK